MLSRSLLNHTNNQGKIERNHVAGFIPSHLTTRSVLFGSILLLVIVCGINILSANVLKHPAKQDREVLIAPPRPLSSHYIFPTWVKRYTDLHSRILDPEDKSIEKRFVVIRCGENNTGKYCQGFGMRIYTFTMSLMYAVLTDRALLVDGPMPFPYSTIFSNSTFDWDYSKAPSFVGKLEWKYHNTLNGPFDYDRYEKDLRDTWKEPVMVVPGLNPNAYFRRTTQHKGIESKSEYFGRGFNQWSGDSLKWILMNMLIYPSEKVQTKLDEFDNYRKTYFVIAMHIRTGGFFDDQRHSKEEINWFWDCARNISKFRPSGRKYAWFVTSDHPQMIQTAKTEGEALSIPVFNTKEIYMHTERSRENSTEENWIKTATDWFLLGKSDLFLASKSAFSLSAKYYGLPGYKLIGDRC
eukprot:239045_1